jgi:AraC-like DNA-binding protein
MGYIITYLPLLGAFGVLNGLFTLVFINSNKTIPNKSLFFLNLLIIALIFKLSYSFTFVTRASAPVLTQVLEFFSSYGYLCFGPLLYFYYKKWLDSKFSFRLKHLTFFIIPIILLIYLTNKPNKLLYYQIFNFVFLIATFFYLQRSLFRRNKHLVNKTWAFTLFITFSLIWLSANLLFVRFQLYLVEFIILLSVIFYLLIYYTTAVYWVKKSKSYCTKSATNKLLNKSIIEKASETLTQTKVYKNPDLSLPKLAKIINVSTHQLSEAINVELKTNFNEFINNYRIEAIGQALIDKSDYYTIAAIAYDYGFNSISTFNTNFKKFYGFTPSEYIKTIQPSLIET